MPQAFCHEELWLLDCFIAELLGIAGVEQPPVDALWLAQAHLGMTVCLDGGQRQRGRAQRTGGGQVIYLRPEPRLERRQWAVAHEIGEHLRPELCRRLSFDADACTDPHAPQRGETLANLFAQRLLVPQTWFADDARRLAFDLPALKERYATASHEVIAWRMLDLAEPCIVSIVDNGRLSRRQGNAGPVSFRLTPAEQKCQREVHFFGRRHMVRDAGWTVHGWPVHQPDWRREILRSVPQSFADEHG